MTLLNEHITPDKLRRYLHGNIFRIKFTKVDGQIRNMKCTLIPDLLPELVSDKKEVSEYKDNQIRVYDLDKEAWRSFLFENIIEVEVL